LLEEKVILVDMNDKEIGIGEKIKIHQKGELHRAFSIFVVNSKEELLLQKRAMTKYHSGGLWTNTCCGHPRHGELTGEAARRRLREEMGFGCDIKEIFCFTYRKQFADNLFEHEYDHVFLGVFDGKPAPNPEEVSDWQWSDITELGKNIKDNPELYTYWFRYCFYTAISHFYSDNQENQPNRNTNISV
jgi:isopentenyl-diphosphate delta-isomerase